MKTLLATCLLAAVAATWAADGHPTVPGTSEPVKGQVLEVKDVESYTYIRLKTKSGETWAAVGKAPVKKGAEVTIENPMVMTNFESKSLKQTFPVIVFGSLAGAGGNSANTGGDLARAHAGLAKAAEGTDAKVAKAAGPNARTVAEIATRSADLKDKPVTVRGRVVKYNPGIMGKNWIHLRDGSGSAGDGSNDLLVTTADSAKPGDVLTATGTVRTDKDFGAGYSYRVLVEDATLTP